MGFSRASSVIGLFPSLIHIVDNIFMMFGGYFAPAFAINFFAAVETCLDMVKTILLLMMGVKAITQGTVAMPMIDNLINKHTGN